MNIEVTDSNYQFLVSNKQFNLVKFGATWCNPCRILKPILETLDVGDNCQILDIDIDECPDVSSQFSIRSVPTLILMKNGVEVSRKSGVHSKETLELWIKTFKI